jgi:hypothetical protein
MKNTHIGEIIGMHNVQTLTDKQGILYQIFLGGTGSGQESITMVDVGGSLTDENLSIGDNVEVSARKFRSVYVKGGAYVGRKGGFETITENTLVYQMTNLKQS